MRKDLKIGMIIGVVLITGATLMISLWPDASIVSRQKKAFSDNKTDISANPHLPDNSMTTPAILLDKAEEPETVKSREISAGASPVKTEPEKTEKLHVVKKGETLGDIAEKYYGNRLMINRIVDSNPNAISDSNKIIPGMKLIIEN